MKKFIFVIFSLVCLTCSAQEKVPFPVVEDRAQTQTQTRTPEIPEDLKGLVWNKWSTKNFTIISIDKDQGLFLKNNIEKIKYQLLNNWGLRDVDFKGDCKIVCVSNQKLLERIFRLNSTKFEIRKNENGDSSYVIWFYLDEKKNVPLFEIMQVCIDQLEVSSKDSLPLFCKRGMTILSQNHNVVKQKLLDSKIEKIYFNDIVDSKNNEKDVDSFDVSSAVICLLLRKEYGQDNFLNFLGSKKLTEFGINDVSKMDEIINRYYKNLIEDLKNDKTPIDYLEIKNSRR